MLIATFGPTTTWVGRRITHEGDAFMLDGHGPITADDIMEYDRHGCLVWVNEGARGWVGSKAVGLRKDGIAARARSTGAMMVHVWHAASRLGNSLSADRRALWTRSLWAAIAVLTVINVVLVLFALGAFKGL